MKSLRSFTLLLFSATLLAACNQDVQPPLTSTTPSFSFSVDPASGSAKLQNVDTQALEALQTDTCDAGVRTLTPNQELALVDFEATFLPGNVLTITATFTNTTQNTYGQTFSFSPAPSTTNISSSTEPIVTDADLGGDGALAPNETTSQLTFTVEHMGQPFSYSVFAQAQVNCADNENPVVTFDDPGDLNTGCAVALTGTATDNVAVSSVAIYEGSTLLGDATLSSDTWSYSYTPSAPGTYTLRAVATDAESNSDSAEQNVSVTSPTVVNGNDSGTGSLRQAVADAQAGDTITFACDVETVTLTSSQIAIDKNLTIDGNVTIDGNANSRIFAIDGRATVVLNDLIMTNGFSHNGAGVYNSGNLTLSGTASISGNYSPGNDGGAYNLGTMTLKDNASISNNTANNVTGGIYNGNILNLQDNASISNNKALGTGGYAVGGISNGGTVTLSGSAHISGNSGTDMGGVYNNEGRGTLIGATYDPNDTGSGTGEGGTHNIYGNSPNQVVP